MRLTPTRDIETSIESGITKEASTAIDFSGFSARASVTRRLALFLGTLFFAAAAFGQPDCTHVSRNVLRFENCGFDAGLAGWSGLVGGNAIFNLDEGDPATGSYQIDSVVPPDDGDREVAIQGPCVPIAPAATYQVEARFKIVDPSDAVQCGFFVAGYSDATCSGQPNGMDSAEVRVTGTSWTSLSDTYSSRRIDSSMEIFAFCYENPAGPVFTMLMDNFIAEGPPSRSPLFSNGFESGDTSAWSRTVPEDDDNDSNDDDDDGGVILDLPGQWPATEIEGAIDANGNPLTITGEVSTWTFNPDGTYRWFLHALPFFNLDGTGTYSLAGNLLTVTGIVADTLFSGTSGSTDVIPLTIGNGTFRFRDEGGDHWTYAKNN